MTFGKSIPVAMLKAVTNGDVESVRSYLQSTGDVDVRIDARPNRPARETLLMLAAEKGKSQVVKLLISGGADVNATNEIGQPALLYAARNNHTPISALLKAGADPNLRWTGKDFVLPRLQAPGFHGTLTSTR